MLDPFGLAPGVPQLVWDPVAGCADPMLARRRARAFAAGTVGAATHGDDAAVFYAAQCANVLQCFFHAAALTGRTLDDILAWVANPATAGVATDILTRHPYAAPHWAGMLDRALNGDPRTSANTTATVHQAMDIFFQPAIRARCVPTPGNPATDLRALITEKGTLYLLGRDDPYLSAAPMMTAVAEDILDTVLAVAYAAPHGRLTPPWLSVLDELPSTAPLPTLATRMANDRALGSGYLWAAQTWPQLITLFGANGAAELLGLTNTLIVFGGGNNHDFNAQVADMIGVRQRTHRNYTGGGGRDSWSTTTQDVPRRPRRTDPRHPRTPSPRPHRPIPAHPGRPAPLHRRATRPPAGGQPTTPARATTHPNRQQGSPADADALTRAAVATARNLHLHSGAATVDGNDSR